MPAPLRDWVGSVLGASVTELRRTYVGGSRELYFVESADGDPPRSVLRVEAGGGAFSGTPLTLEREAGILRALAPTVVPVPRVLGVHPDGSAVLLERLDGDSRLRTGADELDRLVASFFSAIGRLHAIDPAELALPDDLLVGDPVEAELDRWERLAATGADGPDPLLRFAFAWLRAHLPPTSEGVLVQGDTGPGNFLHERGTVTGLVDFEMAHVGDRMDDIAWIDLRAATAPGAFGDAARRDREYEGVTGHPVDPARVRAYAVFVRLRCAVITGLALSRGGGAVGLTAYRAPHHRFRFELGCALGDAIGADVAPDLAEQVHPGSPGGSDAGDGLATLRLRCSEASDASEKLVARSALLEAEHELALARFGEQLAAAEAADRRSVVGPVGDARLAELAAVAGAAGDGELLGLLIRSAARAGRCWWTPGVGGPPRSPAPPRSR